MNYEELANIVEVQEERLDFRQCAEIAAALGWHNFATTQFGSSKFWTPPGAPMTLNHVVECPDFNNPLLSWLEASEGWRWCWVHRVIRPYRPPLYWATLAQEGRSGAEGKSIRSEARARIAALVRAQDGRRL